MKLQELKEEELEACEAMLRDDVLMRANVTSTHDNMNTAQAALNVHTLCRICAEAGEHMEEIFGAAQLHTKINLCLPIKVCESDSLSLSVCHSCVARLENSFELATQSQRSDVILRDLQQRQNKEQQQIQVQQQNEEQKYQPCDPIEHRVAVSQISAVNSPVSNMDLSQTSHPNPPNSSTSSECENNAVKNYNLKPLSAQLTRLSQMFVDTFTVKVEQDVSESSQEQMRNDDTNLQDIKLELEFSNTNENDWIEENHRAAGCDVRIKKEVDESCLNLHHIPIDNEILQDEDPLQNEITSELIIKSEHEWSDVEESRYNNADSEGGNYNQDLFSGATENKTSASDLQVSSRPCQICGSVLKLNENYVGLYECEVCKKQFDTAVDFSLLKVINLNVHKCLQCNKELKSINSLNLHVKCVHEEVRSFHCTHKQCSKSFKSKGELKNHLAVHTDVRSFKCDKCSESFKVKKHLQQHNKTVHSEVRPFVCKKCGKSFKLRFILSQHMNVHNKELNFKCEKCDKKFKSQHNLYKHKQVHDVVRKFPCTLCDKKFKTKQHLSRHMSGVHSDVRPFSCDICAKSFKSKDELRKHGVVHKTSNDFKCNLCTAKFKRKSELVSHLKHRHSDARPYKCNECEKLYKTKSDLRHHMAGHLNLRQFKCDKCDWSFNFKHQLKKHSAVHLRVISDIFAFKCHVCELRFKQKSEVKEHIFRYHI